MENESLPVNTIAAAIFTLTLISISKPVRHAVRKTPDAYKDTKDGEKETHFMRFILHGGFPRLVADCILLGSIFNVTATWLAVLRPQQFEKVCPCSSPSLFSPTSLAFTILPALALVLGTKIRLRAFEELADSFTYTLTKPKNGLKTDGIYRYIRHPSYTGLYILGLAGGFICIKVVDCWIPYPHVFLAFGVVEFALCITFLRTRVETEEKFLKKEFGKEYVEYMDRSWRLIPWVY
ncbi:hypothetical protein BJ508DRAFT_411994 [Ascobolus immersus RN42]|uniref:Protein-S-isoprenylcysteine O-methyltransferase n=1 Tax=Ascobolus immersus RN42 TaxID=1160509 RepID=A0A3N4IIE4_ASCIM|nr:hypothetical protein BJ508DRAFT_411994 [Ascobolus immersus RN42]